MTSLPLGLAKPHRILALVPVLVAFIAVVGAAGLAITHLAAKGGAPQATGLQGPATQAQIATGQTPPSRGVYNGKDLTEPDLR